MSFFDLQLFAEGEVDVSAAQPAGQEVAQPVAQPETVPDNVEQEAAPEPKYALVTDEKTGRRVVREIVKEAAPSEQQSAPTAPQQEVQEPQQGQQAPQGEGLLSDAANQQQVPYTQQEFLVALQLGAVDESRVPPALAMQYGAYKARMMQVQQPQAGREASQETPQNAQQELYRQIAAAAHQKALEAAGMTPEEYEVARFADDDAAQMEKMRAYNTAYQWSEGEIVKGMQQQQEMQQRAMQERVEIYRDIDARVAELKVQEPHFQEIDDLMATRYQTLPYQEAQAVAQTIEAFKRGVITPQQCKVLEKYYEDTRLAYYAQQNNLPQTPKPAPKPPTVETPGSGESLPQSVDFAAMRNMNVRERRAFISNYFKNR